MALQVVAAPDFHDSHFHLTNYIQEGTDVRDLLDMMGSRIGRSTIFGIPLQQLWYWGISAIGRRPITCRAMPRSITTRLPIPTSSWDITRLRQSSGPGWTL